VIRANNRLFVTFANTNLVNCCFADRSLAEKLRNFLVLNDGIGLTIASYLTVGRGFRENLNGTDFTPALLEALPSTTRVYLLGSRPPAVKKAAAKFERDRAVTVVGYCDGYSLGERKDTILQEIDALAPDILLVALGNPLQESWIAEHGPKLRVPVLIGVGALFDFESGESIRASLFVRKMRLEWLFRLLSEPRRLGRRYTIDIAYFVIRVLLSKWQST
jgi:beta-1,4-glucosyltransferase